MSGYNGRRGPNVTQFLANLNTISPQQEQLSEPQFAEDEFALFTNTHLFDSFEAGSGNVDLSGSLDLDLDVDSQRPSQANPTNTSTGEPKMDSSLYGNFQFADFDFSSPIVDPSLQSLPHSQPNNFPVAPNYTSPESSAVSPTAPGFEHNAGKKRKLEHADPNSQQAIDETARVAAEEDKRRRNTAASARFRIKKKQREQALEKTAKEMSEKVSVLETKIQQLETENAWLKGLITEKNGGKTSTSEIRAMLSKHEESNIERSSGGRTDGVGTRSEAAKD